MLRRRGRPRGSRDQAQSQAQAALGNVANHAEAGKRAQITDPMWAPPPTWSQALSAQIAAPQPPAAELTPPPPAPPPPAMLPPVPPPIIPSPPKPAATTPPAPVPPASAPEALLPVAELTRELVRVLDTVSTMCERVITTIESDRAERRLMLEAMTALVERASQTPVYVQSNGNGNGNGGRVIGGSVDAIAATTIDLREPDTPVEVKCRFGDRWVDGFEICEVLREGTSVRYRLRRRVDSVVLPELFDASDIRHVETFEELTSTPRQQRQWSSL
jgi:hypothetical protein